MTLPDPIFEASRAKAVEKASGISISVSPTQDLETIFVNFYDPKYGPTDTMIHLLGSHILDAGGDLCGYRVDLMASRFRDYLPATGHTIGEIKRYLEQGLLRLCSARTGRKPEDSVIVVM